MYPRIFQHLTKVYFVIFKSMEGILIFLRHIIGFLIQKVVSMCSVQVSVWEMPTLFEQCVWYLPVNKHAILPCCWKRHQILFLLIQCVTTKCKWFVTDDHFFHHLSLFPKKHIYILFVFLYFNFSHYSFNL